MSFVLVSIVITLDRTRFNINVQQLREEIKKELNAIVSQNSIIKELISGFNVKLFIVENDAGSSFSVCTNTVRATRYKIVPVFVELTVQDNKDIPDPGFRDNIKDTIEKHLGQLNSGIPQMFSVYINADNSSISDDLKDIFSTF